MYKYLQQQAKEYIIGRLNKVGSNLVFDIDMTDKDHIVVICDGPEGRINIIAEEKVAPQYVLEYIRSMHVDVDNKWEWLDIVRILIKDVFKIYRLDILQNTVSGSNCQVMDYKFGIFGVQNPQTLHYDIVFPLWNYDSQEMIGQVTNKSPLLILLDPLQYFHCFSLFDSTKYTRIKQIRVIYDAIRAHFLEINEKLISVYLMLYAIFEFQCYDIIFLVTKMLISLWFPH